MKYREKFTYLITGRECYVRYFRVSELTIEDEQIRHKPPRDLHTFAAAARTQAVYFRESQKTLDTCAAPVN